MITIKELCQRVAPGTEQPQDFGGNLAGLIRTGRMA